jgi:hypothetical protein
LPLTTEVVFAAREIFNARPYEHEKSDLCMYAWSRRIFNRLPIQEKSAFSTKHQLLVAAAEQRVYPRSAIMPVALRQRLNIR